MTLQKIDFKNTSKRGRRRGVAFIYLALTMLALLGMTGLVVDIGHLHMKEAQAMRAADAAALAGAMQLPDEAKALEVAREYAKGNKYENGKGGTVVTGTVDSANPLRYTVHIEKPEPLFFIRVVPGVGSKRQVGATATAEAEMPQDLDAEMHIGSGETGVGPINLAVFGPQARYSFGDAYSPQWLDDGKPNPLYNGKGYDFRLTIPNDYVARNGTSMVDVQIFDPDGQNIDGNDHPDGKTRIDEIMDAPKAPHAQPNNKYTTTRYQLYKTIDPKDPSKDQLIATAEYGATNADIDMKWVTPEGFTFNVNDYGPGSYRINVTTIDGSSENGFSLRASSPGTNSTAPNGTSISAMGRLPINFNTDGLTTLKLGAVPATAAGRTLTINKFDTDVGAKTVYYTSDPPASNQPPGGFIGELSKNGEWKADQIQLPADYSTATWSATYTAGQQDTTVWELSYATPTGTPGHVKLVGSNGKSY